jgi:hypothetical protein
VITGVLMLGAGLVLGSASSARAGADAWAGYLDYAYVYSSADSEALQVRLEQYGRDAGLSLQDYIQSRYESGHIRLGPVDDVESRRKAIAYLLDYLARAEPESLEKSVRATRELQERLSRNENRYWYHYIRAHSALEKGRRFDFVDEVLDLWLTVVVPLESQFETLQTLSLADSPNSGFASALPYVYENIARMVLIRSPKMGVDRDLEPLGSVVRMLHEGRVGAHPDVIPLAASARPYLDRIVERMNGPESDAGSLTFSLALFEAAKYHERARGLLASEGFSPEALEAIRVASGAYKGALARADTIQGRCAVYTRALRQIGEIYAAKQRLDQDPEIRLPFSVDDAMVVYARMHAAREGGRYGRLGYGRHGRQAYLVAMRGLWEEIQEATLNVADYYLALAVDFPHQADDYSRSSARLYGRYLTFFLKYAGGPEREGVPESAYFAAHEAAKGIGDAFLLYSSHPTREEIELAILRYRGALKVFPFDRSVWSSLAAALERQGRESEYLELARRAAEGVTRSRALDNWIERSEPEADRVATLRRAFSDSQALMYLGFAEATEMEDLETDLESLTGRRDQVEARLSELTARRDAAWASALADGEHANAANATPMNAAERAELEREITETSMLFERLSRQMGARSRTLPLYKATLETDGLATQLRSRRDHPLHGLLRRMYHEDRTS